MNLVKPDNHDLQQQVAEIDERVTRLETGTRPRRISGRETVLRALIVIMVYALLFAFAYSKFKDSISHNQLAP